MYRIFTIKSSYVDLVSNADKFHMNQSKSQTADLTVKYAIIDRITTAISKFSIQCPAKGLSLTSFSYTLKISSNKQNSE